MGDPNFSGGDVAGEAATQASAWIRTVRVAENRLPHLVSFQEGCGHDVLTGSTLLAEALDGAHPRRGVSVAVVRPPPHEERASLLQQQYWQESLPSSALTSGSATVTVFASAGSWIESDAVVQCHQVAALTGMIHVAGMPDLHPGKGAPIGAAMASTVLYPHLVGSDIGCGIAVFPIHLRRVVPERLAGRFPDLDHALHPDWGSFDPAAWTVAGGEAPGGHVEGLATLGRGNHFVELARIQTVLDPSRGARLGIAVGDLVLIVHSGSRGLGERILRSHTDRHGPGPAPDPDAYLALHDTAVRWGSLNRRLIAARVAHALGAKITEPIVDVSHNLVTVHDGVYLHRKGAAPGNGRDVLVAGTRGSCSYLVAAHAGPNANHSVAHGAGRKMSRADALRRGRAKRTVEQLRRTAAGSLVVCGDRQLLFEEAPTAYKRIEQVIGDLVAHGLATPVATTLPLVTYKTPVRPDSGPRPVRRRGRQSHHRGRGRS